MNDAQKEYDADCRLLSVVAITVATGFVLLIGAITLLAFGLI